MEPKLAVHESPWKKCNTCKKPINFGSVYWVCNVSTCNRVRTGLHFCTVECWDAHVPMMRHRESWAEERRAPTKTEWEKILAGEVPAVARKRQTETPKPSNEQPSSTPVKPILRRKSQD